jgi:cold shock CspA family protein/ribosome-associated translation inhibitor RaiA
MAIPLEISLRNVEPSEEAFRAEIERQAEKLGKLYTQIMNCRVVVDAPAGHKRRGEPHTVSVELLLPQKKKVVGRNKTVRERKTYDDVTLAVREAFDAARRQLEEFSRKQSREVKAHETPPHGRVSQVFPEKDHGFITTPDGYEVYFHRNSVVNDGFDKLQVGSEVRFTQERGDKGPQATPVHPVGKHHVQHPPGRHEPVE